ncbi:MAG: aminopeptidase [Deltaproteobacteria bacterium]|nr:aminopeptidase [Deltaproteobacteria bacterium]
MDKNAAIAIDNIFTVNLGVKKTERVLVFSDIVRDEENIGTDERERREGSRRVAALIAEAGKKFAAVEYIEFPSTGSHGTEPPARIWKAAFGVNAAKKLEMAGILGPLLKKTATPEAIKQAEDVIAEHKAEAVNCIVALPNYSTSHTKFRDLCNRFAGIRYASMPLFEESMLSGVMTADWAKINERTVKLADTMIGADKVNVKSKNGTDITFSIKGRPVKPDTGIITAPGSFSNLPAGEAFAAPVEGTAEGTLVIEWAPTRKLASPIKVTVKEGRAVKVEGDEPYVEELRSAFAKNPLFGNIAELGVGTNEKAVNPANVLESEKILGTIHIAFGDNSTFGGTVRVPFHQDFVYFSPTLVVTKDGREIVIIDAGKFLL